MGCFQPLFLQVILCPFLYSPSGTSMVCILVYLMVFCKFLKLCSLFFILVFSFGFSDSIISNDLSSSLLILYSASLSLLLKLSSEFFNSIMLFFSSIISVQFLFIIFIYFLIFSFYSYIIFLSSFHYLYISLALWAYLGQLF